MTLGELKPILTALVLPPASPLLLAILGVVLAWRRRVRVGLSLATLGTAALWLASCQVVANALAGLLLQGLEPVRPQALQSVQAIVVLGGAILPEAPEYGVAQPAPGTLARLRYGATLARRTGKPLAFAGGIGWAAGRDFPPEAEVAKRTLAEFGVSAQWLDSRSRDTAENAREMQRLLQGQGVRRIALVSDSWHLPRAQLEFQRAGFDVVPAPTGFPAAQTHHLLAWLPSADGLNLSRAVLREWLGLAVARMAR